MVIKAGSALNSPFSYLVPKSSTKKSSWKNLAAKPVLCRISVLCISHGISYTVGNVPLNSSRRYRSEDRISMPSLPVRPITGNASPPSGAVAAILTIPDGHYLLQLRDDKPGVWDPGCWGCFGGSIDERESPDLALRRELKEELELCAALQFRYFTQIAWDYGRWGKGLKLRYYFEVAIGADALAQIILHEGQAYRVFSAEEILCEPKLTAYDSHALRMHIRAGMPR